MFPFAFLFLFYNACVILAAPPPAKRALQLSATEINSLIASTAQFARAAYCSTEKLRNWNCGQACDANPAFQPTLVGGDGNDIQIFFVGYSPDEDAIIISHQGTDPLKLQSVLTDLNLDKVPLSPTLFPGIPSGAEVHDGFGDQHALTAGQILQEVKRLMAQEGTSRIKLIGHSLGGALAELDALFLTLNLPPTTTIEAVTFGTPRVGNAAFVQFFDARVPNFKRVNNKDDLVPIIPGRSLGFVHPKGEVHILDEGRVVACAGNDDASDPLCQIKSVPNIFFGSVIDHHIQVGAI